MVEPSAIQAERVALVSDKQLGDVTLLEPLTRLLAGRNGAKCAMHVNPAFRPLVDLMAHARWGGDSGERYDATWTTSWSSRAALRSLKVKTRQRCLLVNQQRHLRWWFGLVYNRMEVVPARSEYWASYFWRALGGDPDAFTPPQLCRPPEEWRHPQLGDEPFVLLNPTAAWPTKFWSPKAWAEVVGALASEWSLPWVMTGGNSVGEVQHCAEIAGLLPSSVLNLAGGTSLRQYLHALSRASAVLCVDGSASHLAQAFGVPTLTVFGPVFPGRWHRPAPEHPVVSAFQFTDRVPPACSDVPAGAVLDAARGLARFMSARR